MQKYKDTQKNAVKLLVNSFNKNRLSHSYIFTSNKIDLAYDFSIEFAKMLLCKNKGCNDCSICRRVENGNHTNIIEISTDTTSIKKEEILNLQKEFSKKNLEEGPKVYIIKNAERMNDSAANSLLKFLEEPSSECYGILLTNNIYKIMKTIQSRSQIVDLKNISVEEDINNLVDILNDRKKAVAIYLLGKKDVEDIINDQEYIKMLDSIFYMLDNFENESILLYAKNNLNKINLIMLKDYINIWIYIMQEVLNYKINSELNILKDELNIIRSLSNLSLQTIEKVINVLNNKYYKCDYNVNVLLTLDSMMIQLEELLKCK